MMAAKERQKATRSPGLDEYVWRFYVGRSKKARDSLLRVFFRSIALT